jgi:Secretion system C-terminal sorting domain
MKKKITIFLLLTLNFTLAQIPDWSWSKNISLYFNNKQDLTAVDNSGNVYLIGDFNLSSATIAGTTFNNTSLQGYSDAYILKFNSSGILLWSKQLTGSLNESITSIDTDSIGNIVIVGTFGNTITFGTTILTSSFGGTFITKLNSNGDYIWATKNIGTNENYFINDIKADIIGNVFIVGTVYSPTLTFDGVIMALDLNNPTVNDARVFIAKFDLNGNCLWGKLGINISTNPMGSIPTSLAPDNNGGVAICGRFGHNNLSFDSIILTKTTQNNNSVNMFTAKFDNNGNTIWAYNSGSLYENSTIASTVSIDSVGNLYVGGSFTNSANFGTNTLNSLFGSQFYLLKYSMNGALLWAQTSGFNTNGYTTIRSIDTDNNNNVYVAGLSFANNINFNNNVTLSNLGNNGSFFVTKYNNFGNAIWAKGVSNIDANNEISIDCNSEDDLFVGGSFYETTLQLGTNLLTKSNANYDIFVGRLNVNPLNLSSFENNSIDIYPNPASEIININNIKKNYNFSLYNLLGELIKYGKLINEQETLNVKDILSGLYILKLTDNEGNSFTKKIIIK